MAASKRVETAKKQRTEVSQPPAAAPSPSSPSSPSFAPSSVTTPAPPFPFHALPAAAGDRLQGYLGFALLMDLRCLSRAACRQLEDAALQWMNHHLLLTEECGAETVGSSSTGVAAPSPPVCCTHVDAVWFRQQLSRWRFECTRSDAEHCTVGAADAFRAYGVCSSTPRSRRGWDEKLTTSYLVTDAVAYTIRYHRMGKNAVTPLPAFAWKGESCRARAAATATVLAKDGLAQAQRIYDIFVATSKTTARWWRASWRQPTPLLLLLPVAVAQHSVLSFFSFEDVMELRVLSRALRPLLESVAIAQLNHLCPSGVATIARLEGQVRARAERARVRVEPEKETKRELRSSRKRKLVDDAAASIGVLEPFTSSLSPATTSSSSSPSPPLPASTSSSSTSPPPSPLPTASYTVAHCVWAMQQLQWCRRLHHNATLMSRRPRDLVQPVMCRKHFLSRFPFERQWTKRFGASSTRTGWGGHRPTKRPSAFEVLDLVLGLHGRVVGGSSRQQRKTRKRRAGGDEGQGTASGGGAPQPAGCPTLLSTEGRTRCLQCTQITVQGR